MKQGFFLGLIAMVMMGQAAWAQTRLVDGGEQLQVGRYTTQSAQPPAELSDPLSVYAQLNFPRQAVATVGQALDYTLMRTGYRLVDIEALGDRARRFLSLPLPESQRRVGPYSVKTILEILLGSAWTLKTDPISRQVWFELDAVEPASPSASPANVAPKASESTQAPVKDARAEHATTLSYFEN